MHARVGDRCRRGRERDAIVAARRRARDAREPRQRALELRERRRVRVGAGPAARPVAVARRVQDRELARRDVALVRVARRGEPAPQAEQVIGDRRLGGAAHPALRVVVLGDDGDRRLVERGPEVGGGHVPVARHRAGVREVEDAAQPHAVAIGLGEVADELRELRAQRGRRRRGRRCLVEAPQIGVRAQRLVAERVRHAAELRARRGGRVVGAPSRALRSPGCARRWAASPPPTGRAGQILDGLATRDPTST